MTRKKQVAIGKVALGSAQVSYGLIRYFGYTMLGGGRPPSVLDHMAGAKAVEGGKKMLKQGWKELNE